MDLAPLLDATALRELFERAEYLEVLDRGRLRALLPRCRGVAKLRALADLEPPSPSPGSARSSSASSSTPCRTHSLPLPAVNVPLLGYEVDFLWEEARLVVEADGGQHRGEAASGGTTPRDLALQRAGYLVRRYTDEDLADECGRR